MNLILKEVELTGRIEALHMESTNGFQDERILKAISRVLVEGGQLIAQFQNGESETILYMGPAERVDAPENN